MPESELRPWHWLRTNEGTSIPKVVTVLACASKAEPIEGRPMAERRTLRAWSARTWRTDRSKPAIYAGSGELPAAFWYHLADVKRKGTSHWIFAYELKDQLAWLKFWDKLNTREIIIHKAGDYRHNNPKRLFWQKPGWAGALIVSDPPTWIKCRWSGGVMNWCDVRNYVKEDLEKFAAAVGVELPDDVDDAAELPAVVSNLDAEVEVLSRWLSGLLETWDSEQLGNWRPTGSGLAWNAFRHKFLEKRSVLVHANPDALKLERAAYFGGRCIVGFVGEIKKPRQRNVAKIAGKTPLDGPELRGPVWRYDINSCYAAVMKNYDYPSRLLCLRGSISEAQLAAWVHEYCLIACVKIDSPGRAYPVRRGNQVHWRTGQFWVCLTTGELLDALERGLIRNIGQTAIYERKRLFPAYVDWAYAKKNLEDTPANKVHREFGKVLTTSLYGRWGQVRQGWQDLPGQDPHGVWGMWHGQKAAGLPPSKYRAIGCAVQEYYREGETLDSCPAIAAHVTAYARLLADFWLDQLPAKSLLYHDCDSFHVLRAGHNWITGRPASVGNLLEQLKLEDTADDACYYGQKHYRFGNTFRLGSMAKPWRLVEGGAFETTVAEPIDSLLSRPLDGSTVNVVETRTVEAMPIGRWIGPDGFTAPYELKLDSAETWKAQEAMLAYHLEAQGQEQAVHAAMQAARLF